MPFLFILLLFFSSPAHAKNPINLCFQDEETDGGISLCLTYAYNDIDNKRKIMESELEDMIKNNLYVPPPKFNIDESTVGISTPTFRPETQSEIEAQRNLILAKEKLKRQGINKQELQMEFKLRKYEDKKVALVNHLKKSIELFEKYRDLECDRQRSRIENNENTYESTYTYKICLYEMTSRRIKSLQKSLKQ